MNWNINKTYTTRRSFPYKYIVHLFNILAHNSYTLRNTQINHSNKDTFYHQNNIYTTTSKQFLGQAGNKLEQQYTYWYVSIYRSDTCIGPASSLAELWLYNLSLYWSTILMQYPYVHQLNAIWNDHTMVVIFINGNKRIQFLDTVKVNKKNHNDKTKDDQDV